MNISRGVFELVDAETAIATFSLGELVDTQLTLPRTITFKEEQITIEIGNTIAFLASEGTVVPDDYDAYFIGKEHSIIMLDKQFKVIRIFRELNHTDQV